MAAAAEVAADAPRLLTRRERHLVAKDHLARELLRERCRYRVLAASVAALAAWVAWALLAMLTFGAPPGKPAMRISVAAAGVACAAAVLVSVARALVIRADVLLARYSPWIRAVGPPDVLYVRYYRYSNHELAAVERYGAPQPYGDLGAARRDAYANPDYAAWWDEPCRADDIPVWSPRLYSVAEVLKYRRA